jgi:hypothetical protein
MVVVSPVIAQASTARAHWGFNEPGSPPQTLVDDSGTTPPNNGTPHGGITGTGAGYVFDGTGKVVVPNAPTLNPGSVGFSFSVTLTTPLPARNTDFDVIRKGLASKSAGDYKLEILNVSGQARAFCVVRDSAGHAGRIRSDSGNLADGQQHRVTCSKTSTGVSVTVDDRSPITRTVSGGIGSVSNGDALSIGAKVEGGDPFKGTIWDATIS